MQLFYGGDSRSVVLVEHDRYIPPPLPLGPVYALSPPLTLKPRICRGPERSPVPIPPLEEGTAGFPCNPGHRFLRTTVFYQQFVKRTREKALWESVNFGSRYFV